MAEKYIPIALLVVFFTGIFSTFYVISAVIAPKLIKIDKIIDLKLDEMLDKGKEKENETKRL